MSERDELAAMIHDALDADEPVSWNEGYIPTAAIMRAADAVLAGGWRKVDRIGPTGPINVKPGRVILPTGETIELD